MSNLAAVYRVFVALGTSLCVGSTIGNAEAQSETCPEAPPASLTLAQAVARALCLDPSLAQARANLRRSQAALSERRAALTPTWSVSATPGASTQRANSQTTDSTTAGATIVLSHTLADGGARAARILQTSDDVKASEETVEADRQDAQRDFVGLWADTRDAQATLEAALAAESAARSSLAAAQARFGAGTATRVDLLSAESAKAQAERDVLSARTALRKAMGLLARRLGWSPDAQIMLVGEDILVLEAESEFSQATLETFIAELRQRHPLLAAQRARVNALVAALDAARADAKPTLKLTGQAGPNWSHSNPSTAGSYDGTQWAAEIGLNWSMTFSDGGARDARIAQARAQLDAARAQEQTLSRDLDDNLWQRYTDWRDADANLSASLAALDAARAAEAAQRGRYSAGLGTLTDLLASQSDLAERQRQAALARQQRLRSRAGLLHALGTLDLADLSRTP
jgi:outer membrane protein